MERLPESPWLVFLVSVAGVFLIEIGVMLVLSVLPPMPTLAEAALDGLILSVISVAFLWRVMFVPMRAALQRRLDTEKEKDILQTQLFHSAKLASIGTMAAGVAHEINNPLAIILGNEDLLRARLKQTGADPDLMKYLDRQKTAGDRILRIVNSLRVHARADHAPLESSVDLAALYREVQEMTDVMLTGSGIDLIIQPFGETYVRGDQGKLHQVMMNLISNAKDALNGKVSGTVRVQTAKLGESIEIHVSDNGSGIPKANLSKIFDPFYTTKPPGEGTGLGLSISQSIIASMGGTLGVESEEGKGSTFILRLAAAPGPNQILPKVHGSSIKAAASRNRVLIVEDEPEVREILSEWLLESGYEVDRAQDGVNALQKIQHKHFDIVVTDLQMPRMSGTELIGLIRSSGLYPTMKVVLLTGGISSDAIPADGFLSKPFTKQALLELLLSFRA